MQDKCIAHTFADGEMTLNEAISSVYGAIVHGRRVGKGALVGMKAVIMDEAIIR